MGKVLSHANADDAVLAARHGALDKNQVLLGVDANDLEVLNGHGIAAHVTRKADALEDAGRRGALADGAGSAMEVRTVAARAAAEAVALDNALEALTFGDTGNVDLLDLGECLDGLEIANLVLASVLDADLAQIAGRLSALLGEMDQPWAC